jgi:hypothetical protein
VAGLTLGTLCRFLSLSVPLARKWHLSRSVSQWHGLSLQHEIRGDDGIRGGSGFFNLIFQLRLTRDEKSDLVAFLQAL